MFKKIRVEDLELGMFVSDMNTPWIRHPFIPNRLLLRWLCGWSGTHFPPYAQRFIQCVGIYPVGTAVRLDTGEIGVVIRQNRADLLRPWVKLVCDVRGQPLRRWGDADLLAPDPACAKPFTRSVATVLDPCAAGIDVDAVLSGVVTTGAQGAPQRLSA